MKLCGRNVKLQNVKADNTPTSKCENAKIGKSVVERERPNRKLRVRRALATVDTY